MKRRFAVLDGNNRLIDAKNGTKLPASTVDRQYIDLDPGDLPLNGTYKFNHDRQSFIPLGHGFERPSRKQPYSTEFIMVRMIEHMGDDAPAEAIAWAAWYNATLRQRDEELTARGAAAGNAG